MEKYFDLFIQQTAGAKMKEAGFLSNFVKLIEEMWYTQIVYLKNDNTFNIL